MFVAGVYVRLCPDAHNPVEMMHINVHEHPVQSRQNLLALWLERFRERNVRCHRKQLEYRELEGELLTTTTHHLVIDLRLHPVHQQGDVHGSGEVRWLLIFGSVLPQILKLGSTRHGWATLSRALSVINLK